MNEGVRGPGPGGARGAAGQGSRSATGDASPRRQVGGGLSARNPQYLRHRDEAGGAPDAHGRAPGVGGALSPLQQAKIPAGSETPIRMPRASGCHGSAGAGGSRRHCTEQQGPQSTGRWESPSPSSPRALSLSGLGWFPPPPGRAASPSA